MHVADADSGRLPGRRSTGRRPTGKVEYSPDVNARADGSWLRLAADASEQDIGEIAEFHQATVQWKAQRGIGRCGLRDDKNRLKEAAFPR
jgi:hypothetical protein